MHLELPARERNQSWVWMYEKFNNLYTCLKIQFSFSFWTFNFRSCLWYLHSRNQLMGRVCHLMGIRELVQCTSEFTQVELELTAMKISTKSAPYFLFHSFQLKNDSMAIFTILIEVLSCLYLISVHNIGVFSIRWGLARNQSRTSHYGSGLLKWSAGTEAAHIRKHLGFKHSPIRGFMFPISTLLNASY